MDGTRFETNREKYEGDLVYQADQGKWLPLGMFAMTSDVQASGPNPGFFLQLAISKQVIEVRTLPILFEEPPTCRTRLMSASR
jgi:hypothetical protein